GGLGVVEASTSVYPRSLEQCLNLLGERGTVCLAGRNLETVRVWEVEGRVPAPRIHAEEEAAFSGHLRVIEGMAQAVREGGTPPVGGDAARDALELVLALRMSAMLGKPVNLPLSPEGVGRAQGPTSP
ncbi:MAG: hypothetical protein K6T75_10965, partial [Acetobacteraceae bacterium]|nr:hypothetical protein [Acetobacteraceae bacterium]